MENKASREQANPVIANINQLCLCEQKVIEYPSGWRHCYSCCKVMEKKQKGYYRCNAKPCTYRQMRGVSFKVCSACYESVNSSNMDSKRSFLFCKVASMMERIKKETEQCKDNDERRRYMYWVYFL
eukprot:199114_1